MSRYSVAVRGSLVSLLAAVHFGCGPAPSGQIRVEVVPPQTALTRDLQKEFFSLFMSSTPCSLPVSRITATSATQGTAFTTLGATVDLSAAASAASGDSILTFDGTASLTLTPAADWIISYIGAYGSTDCLNGRPPLTGTFLSVGRTGPLSLTQDGATVPITVTTRAGVVMKNMEQAFLDGTNNELIRFPNEFSPSICTSVGTIDVLLADGTLLNRSAISYSVGGLRAVTTGDLVVGPVPADTSLIFQVHKTDGVPKVYTIPVQTGHATSSTSEVSATTETGFCSNNIVDAGN